MGNKNEYPSFWLSYANVIGGLFFIITLILTSMLAKYNIIAQDLNKSKGILENKIKDINELKLKLSEHEIAIDKTLSTLQNSKDKSVGLAYLQKILNKSLQNARQSVEEINKITNNEQKKANLKQQEPAPKPSKNPNALRLKIIAKLKILLNNQAQINTQNGTLYLNSDLIFEKNAQIKQSAKANLEQILSLYFDVLLSDEIAPHIKHIIITSHTDLKKSYTANLKLSQAQALELLLFANSFYNDALLTKLSLASGRANTEPFYKNGKIDENLSRRIEISFIENLNPSNASTK